MSTGGDPSISPNAIAASACTPPRQTTASAPESRIAYSIARVDAAAAAAAARRRRRCSTPAAFATHDRHERRREHRVAPAGHVGADRRRPGCAGGRARRPAAARSRGRSASRAAPARTPRTCVLREGDVLACSSSSISRGGALRSRPSEATKDSGGPSRRARATSAGRRRPRRARCPRSARRSDLRDRLAAGGPGCFRYTVIARSHQVMISLSAGGVVCRRPSTTSAQRAVAPAVERPPAALWLCAPVSQLAQLRLDGGRWSPIASRAAVRVPAWRPRRGSAVLRQAALEPDLGPRRAPQRRDQRAVDRLGDARRARGSRPRRSPSGESDVGLAVERLGRRVVTAPAAPPPPSPRRPPPARRDRRASHARRPARPPRSPGCAVTRGTRAARDRRRRSAAAPRARQGRRRPTLGGRDRRADAVPHGDEAALFEPADALAHDAAANLMLLDEVRLARQQVARGERARDDLSDEHAHDFLVEARHWVS